MADNTAQREAFYKKVAGFDTSPLWTTRLVPPRPHDQVRTRPHIWDFDNVILLDLPDYGTLDRLEADEATRALGHRAGEWMFERHHSMFLRERLGPDLEYHG